MIDNLDQIQGISISVFFKSIIENVKDKLNKYSESGNNKYFGINNYIVQIFFYIYKFYIEIPHIFNFKNFISLWLENQIPLYNSILELFKNNEVQTEKNPLKQSLLNGIYI